MRFSANILKYSFLTVMLIHGIFCPEAAARQPENLAFSRLEIGIHGLANSNRETFHRYWKPGKGVSLSIKTPFYWGSAKISARFLPYRGQRDDVPDFNSLTYLLAWGKNIYAGKKIVFFAAPQIGSFATLFDERKYGDEYEEIAESEFCFGAHMAISIRPRKNWRLQSGIDYLTIYSQKRTRLVFVSLGVVHSFRTPEWLRKILF